MTDIGDLSAFKALLSPQAMKPQLSLSCCFYRAKMSQSASDFLLRSGSKRAMLVFDRKTDTGQEEASRLDLERTDAED